MFATQLDYPYFGQNDYCKDSLISYNKYVATDAYRLSNVSQIKEALKQGPVSVGVAVSDAFVFYTGGVLNDPLCGSAFEELGHAVVLVGWGTDAQYGEYWIVRNSWSNRWGRDGYIYIQIEGNVCGVQTDASVVEMGLRA